MKIQFFFFFFFVISNSFAQNIKGKVVDELNDPLPGANIYFDGTTITTISDENGNFSLYYGTKNNSALVVSFIGYKTVYITTIDSGSQLQIILEEASNKLNEVVITKNRFSRKQKMKLFKEQFLGTTKAGKKAIIENEDDIYFDYNESEKTLYANSDKPIVINNVLLGYKLNYELVNFKVVFHKISINSEDISRSLYMGFCRFEETSSNTKILKEREKCYKGSQLHFFRNLIENIWDKDNFLLFKGSFQVNPSDYFTIKEIENNKQVNVKSQLKSIADNKFNASFNLLFDNKEQSGVIFETDTFYVDQFGNNSNINNIIFFGNISMKKTGDLLPLNYELIKKTP